MAFPAKKSIGGGLFHGPPEAPAPASDRPAPLGGTRLAGGDSGRIAGDTDTKERRIIAAGVLVTSATTRHKDAGTSEAGMTETALGAIE